MSSLVALQGPDRGRRWEVPTGKSVLGRDARCSLRLHDDESSRQHAELQFDGANYTLVDLQSSNGTFLNGTRVTRATLRHGDRIRVGRTELLLNAAAPAVDQAEVAKHIDVVGKADDDGSAILHTVEQRQGSQILAKPDSADSEWMKSALANLAVMYEASQAVSRIGDIGQLLEHIMDLAFKSVPAGRGCIALVDPETKKVRPTVVRYAPEVDPDEKIRLSRTILEHALVNGEGVLAFNDDKDVRFSGSRSMAKLGIHEAMCAPLVGRYETLGAIYVDVRGDRKQFLKTGEATRFTPEHLKLLVAVARQAGLALEDNRFHQAMLQAERLAAVGQTFAAISHHVKNILQGVLSANDLVDFGIKENNFDLVKQGWGVVRRNQQRIYALVTDMLTISKERQPELHATDFGTLVRDVAELQTARAKELGVEFVVVVDEDMPTAPADGEQLHRALLNLVGNAFDAVQDADEPRVELACRYRREKKRFEISVTDNGTGIEAADLERIFQVFVSTKGSRGTGLGLPVTRKILREHDGDVEVRSKVGEGSVFTLWLPHRESAEAAS